MVARRAKSLDAAVRLLEQSVQRAAPRANSFGGYVPGEGYVV